jgi:hypothetical protein
VPFSHHVSRGYFYDMHRFPQDGGRTSKILQHTDMSVLNFWDCSQKIGQIHSSQFCVTSERSGICEVLLLFNYREQVEMISVHSLSSGRLGRSNLRRWQIDWIGVVERRHQAVRKGGWSVHSSVSFPRLDRRQRG